MAAPVCDQASGAGVPAGHGGGQISTAAGTERPTSACVIPGKARHVAVTVPASTDTVPMHGHGRVDVGGGYAASDHHFNGVLGHHLARLAKQTANATGQQLQGAAGLRDEPLYGIEP